MNKKAKGSMPAALVLAAMLMTAPAFAQADGDRSVRGERVVIEIDDDGRILLNGTPMEGDAPVILRVRPDDGAIEVRRIGPDRRTAERARLFQSRRPARGAALFRGERTARQMAEQFRIRIREFEPLLDDVRDRLGSWTEERRELSELERETRQLAAQARRAEGAERAELEAELRGRLVELFEQRERLEQERLERREEALRDERQRLESRREARDEVIDRRFRTLMGEEDVLDW